MKKVSAIVFLLTIMIITAFSQEKEKINAAVLDLKARGVSESTSSIISDALRGELFKYEKFKIMNREDMKEVMEEQSLQNSGVCDTKECYVEIGLVLGVEKIITGSVGKIGTTYTLTIKVIDIESAENEKIINSKKKGSEDLLLEMIENVGRELSGLKKKEVKKKKNKTKNKEKIPVFKGMIFVEGGSFDRKGNKVTVSDYYISKYEVTQKEWKEIMANNPSKFKGENLPVERVSWNDIQEYLKKLNKKTGGNYRLPTEAEWEFAARGGNKSRGYKYSGSDDIDDVAWYDKNSYDKGSNHSDYGTHSVGSKKSNELGIYDMSGNVWEWCNDWYGNYANGSVTNSKGPSSGSSRVERGGSWYNYAGYSTVASRDGDKPSQRYDIIGFRVLRTR